MPSSEHSFLNSTKSICGWLTYFPESPFTPGHLSILNNSGFSSVSVTITHGISVTSITELRSRRCMNTISLEYSSIRCWCLKSASKSFSDTAIFSFPKRFAASSTAFALSGLEKFSIARFAPAYKIFFTSSCRLILPPATIGIRIKRLIRRIKSMASSCSSSDVERSNTSNSSAPWSL